MLAMSTLRQQAVADVDAQISRHRNEICLLLSKRNALMPISQLPAEILGRIFLFVQLALANDEGVKPESATKLPVSGIEWIKISHVTQNWREVAINQTSLWTSPPMRHTRWAIEMLKRSRTAPVRIMLDAALAEAESRVLSAIISHMSHVATFNVWKASPTFLRQFFHHLPASMPVLEEISINVHLLGDGGQDNTPQLRPSNEQALTLPDSICRRAPNLRRLQLVNININWDSPVLSSLTTLVLFFIPAPPTLAQLKSTLERMPNLDTLTLQHALPIPSSSDTPHGPPITLSKLKKLTLGGDPDNVEYFFAHFATPGVKHVHCSFIYQEGSYDLPFILSTIKHPYSRPSSGPRSVLFFYHRLFLSQIAFAEAEDSHPALNLKIIALENLTLPASVHETDTLTTQFFAGVDWSRLHDINIAKIFVSADVLARTFGSLPSLEKIYVGAQSTLPLIEALKQGAGVDPASDPTSVVFPGLKEVSMHNVAFETGFFPDPSEVKLDDLLDCLMSRHERGVDIHRLTLKECTNLEEDDVELLEEIVVEVDWDHATKDPFVEEEVERMIMENFDDVIEELLNESE